MLPEDPGMRLRLASELASVLMDTPEFERVGDEVRELRALLVAGQLLDAMERWLKVAQVGVKLSGRTDHA